MCLLCGLMVVLSVVLAMKFCYSSFISVFGDISLLDSTPPCFAELAEVFGVNAVTWPDLFFGVVGAVAR